MKPARKTHRVLLSCNARDVELARDITRRLKAAGFKPVEVSEAPTDVTKRKNALRKQFRTVDAVVLLVTPAAVASPWLMTELGMADGVGKVIIAVIASLGEDPLPEPLQSYQTVPFDRLDEARSELKRELARPKE
jgi:hypothetical protein